ncbi:hypothetical protein EDB84DRAFT_1281176, partial [Lactarius hengduanensis]
VHVSRYCVPIDNQRPQLDLKIFDDICPDRNVPVIVVFTKYDQFRRNVQTHLEDIGSSDDNIFDAADKQFREHYLPLVMMLDSCDEKVGSEDKYHSYMLMFFGRDAQANMGCDGLIETTAAALNDNIVASMLLAVQRDQLKLSVQTALYR